MGYDPRGSWYRWNKKQIVENSLTLSTRVLAKGLNRVMDAAEGNDIIWSDVLQWTLRSSGRVTNSVGCTIRKSSDSPVLHLQYTMTRGGEAQQLDYHVATTYTVPNFGGRRWWFLCPFDECGRRVSKLHLPPGARYFSCRHCHDLTYESTRQNDLSDRIDRRLWAILHELKSKNSILDPLPNKPKGMHWTTYSRLANEYLTLQNLRHSVFLVEVTQLISNEPYANDGPTLPSPAELKAELDLLWKAYLEQPDRPYFSREKYYRMALRTLQEDEKVNEKPRRGTLGELARKAGVPYDFAREAQANGLIRPDGGRNTRRKRYRYKLASWLKKLHLLRNSGYSWEELQEWASRRFRPGHEHERRWPAGFESI